MQNLLNPDTLIYIAIVIYSIILHEIAHGYVAYLCGDNTAKNANRLTLNPVPHIDPVGSIILPIIAVLSGFGVFGWAKGVPVNLYNLGSKLKQFMVAAAGVLTNLLIASLFLFLIKFGIGGLGMQEIFFKVAIVNIGLGFFNLLPIPPFDGMSMLRSVFPKLGHRYEHLEHNPVAMIISILIASKVFGMIYPSIITFVIVLFGLK
jgi:Zn-dependent protease